MLKNVSKKVFEQRSGLLGVRGHVPSENFEKIVFRIG